MNTNSPITKDQVRCISTLISKLGMGEHKSTLVQSFTFGRTESRAEMKADEAKELIQYLKRTDPDEVKAETQRRKIISMAHEMKWELPGTKKADMKRLDEWCKKYGMYHKHLNSHTLKELPYLVTQFGAYYMSYLKTL